MRGTAWPSACTWLGVGSRPLLAHTCTPRPTGKWSPAVPELDVLIDGAWRQRACHAAEEFIRNHGAHVHRAQIAGLLQIAVNEPRLLAPFAGKQKDRAQKREESVKNPEHRAQLAAEVLFWEYVQNLAEGK